MAVVAGALKYVGKKVGGAVARDVLQHEVERHPVAGQALAAGQFASQAFRGKSLPGMKAGGSVIGRVGATSGLARGINQRMEDVRSGNIRERNQVNKMASLNQAYEDMIELKKVAGIGLSGRSGGGGGGGSDKKTLKDIAKEHGVKTLMSLGAAGAIAGGKKALDHYKSEKTWNEIVNSNPEFDDEKHRENFEVLKKFSPSIASNKTTAKSYLQRAAHAGMMPHEFVKDLTAIEKTRDDSSISGMLAKKAHDRRFLLRSLLNSSEE